MKAGALLALVLSVSSNATSFPAMITVAQSLRLISPVLLLNAEVLPARPSPAAMTANRRSSKPTKPFG